MAKTYRPYVPEEDLLLPPSLRDWLPEDHVASFVSDLIDQFDLSAIAHTNIDAYILTRSIPHGTPTRTSPRAATNIGAQHEVT